MQEQETTSRRHILSRRLDHARTRFRVIRSRVHDHVKNTNTALTHIISRARYKEQRVLGYIRLQAPSPRPVLGAAMDGAGEKRPPGLNRQSHAPVAAIFVHAGAGYHSTTNEKIHLAACAE